MIKGGSRGGSTKTGLFFEGKSDLATFLNSQSGYEVRKGHVYFRGAPVARIFKKYDLYKFLEELKIDWEEIISKRLLPDDSIYVVVKNTLYVIECKFQEVQGSVDEKLQTCDFKKKQYQRLFSRANIEVEYIYLLGEWFGK